MTAQHRPDGASARATAAGGASPDPRSRPVTVLLVDDHQLFRQGLRVLLDREAPGIEVVGEAATLEDALAVVAERPPSVVLMDLNLRDSPEGAGAIKQIRDTGQKTRVVVLSVFDAEPHVVGALRAGATGYLTKSASIGDVVRAIELAAAGGSYIEPALAPLVMAEYRKLTATRGARVKGTQLSNREITLLEMLASGLNNRQIAQEMSLAESTIKNSLSLLFRKIGVRDRTQAVLLAIESGIVAPKSGR